MSHIRLIFWHCLILLCYKTNPIRMWKPSGPKLAGRSWSDDQRGPLFDPPNLHSTCYWHLANWKDRGSFALFFRHRCCLQKSENCERPLATICGSMRHGKDENPHNRFARYLGLFFFSSRTCAMIHFTFEYIFFLQQDQPFPLLSDKCGIRRSVGHSFTNAIWEWKWVLI